MGRTHIDLCAMPRPNHGALLLSPSCLYSRAVLLAPAAPALQVTVWLQWAEADHTARLTVLLHSCQAGRDRQRQPLADHSIPEEGAAHNPATQVTAGSTQLRRYSLDPKDLGIPRCEVRRLGGRARLAPLLGRGRWRLGATSRWRLDALTSAGGALLGPPVPLLSLVPTCQQGACVLPPLSLQVSDLAGGDAALNARILIDVFGGARGGLTTCRGGAPPSQLCCGASLAGKEEWHARTHMCMYVCLPERACILTHTYTRIHTHTNTHTHTRTHPTLAPSHAFPGPVADALNLNAGVALAAAQVAPDPATGVAMAQEAQRAGEGRVGMWVCGCERVCLCVCVCLWGGEWGVGPYIRFS